MRIKLTYKLSFLLTVLMMQASAQISPGELTRVHMELEGLSNCTKCHTLGDKVSNDKCLECHQEIQSRIMAGTGYHVSSEVRGQDCFKCHSDHHGRKFDIIRFDTERFEHDLTGYTLTGAHVNLDCATCHQPGFISDRELKQKNGTYLGLRTECVSCHTDFHQSTLGNHCTDCHTTEAFVPASEFSHDNTGYPLKGAHKQVDCASCHEVSTRNGSSFQEFAGIAFTNCSSCHEDVHHGRFGANCKECHVEESFHTFRGMENFNHSKTQFPLLGKHRTIGCAQCHDTHTTTGEMFKDYNNRDVSNCISCHDDVHQARFGTDCRSCHSEQAFQSIKNLEAFNHDLTDFALMGKHVQVDCKTCHETKMTDPLPHTQCADCHEDYHEGQFVSAGRTPDCAACHTVDAFAGSSFTIEQHNAGNFVLTGAHLATPCFACHQREEKWYFRNIGTRCISCHDDVHAGTLAEKYYPDKSCTTCHSTESWKEVSFDHDLTDFSLEGAHLGQSCTGCHEPGIETGRSYPVAFSGLSTVCIDCHENIHRSQFEIDGVTDCLRCHGYAQWQPSVFDHHSARFVLEGAHLEVACADCHSETMEEGATFTMYRTGKLKCVDCHQ